MTKTKILFLNPPGKKIYIRDYYCSKVSKAYYLPQPVDLLMQTGFFSDDNYDLKVIDAIAENWNAEKTLREVKQYSPDNIIGLIGSASIIEDENFYNEVHEKLPDCKIYCSGDVLLENEFIHFQKYTWLTGIISDFYKPAVVSLLEDNLVSKGLRMREMNGYAIADESTQKLVMLPTPKHHLFNNNKYRMPFATSYPMATVLTNYACPYPCTFCIMSFLEFKSRTAEAIIDELEYLNSLGIKFIYFSDQTFYTIPKIMDQVLDHMIENDLGFKWMCFSRVDLMTEARLTKMKAAGCQLIMYGVEWAEDIYLKQYKKQYTVEQIRKTFALTNQIGIKRLGTFLIGVPGQTRESIENTFRFAIEIDADYASFNVAVPRSNTSFRKEAIDKGLIEEDQLEMDQSGSYFVMGTGHVSEQELASLKKKGYRMFYLRTRYLVNRILELRSFQELKNHLFEGWFVVKSHILNTRS